MGKASLDRRRARSEQGTVLFVAAFAAMHILNASHASFEEPTLMVTRFTQFRTFDLVAMIVSYRVLLEGDVWWATAEQGRLADGVIRRVGRMQVEAQPPRTQTV